MKDAATIRLTCNTECNYVFYWKILIVRYN